MSENEIAIIGMAGYFPMARHIDVLWTNLLKGIETVTFFSDQELLSAGLSSDLIHNPNYVKARAVLEDIEMFDAPFFGFTPREAETMDPQHRLFLECAWEALENAGYTTEVYKGLIGVYAGTSMSSYMLNNLFRNHDVMTTAGPFQLALGNDKDYLTTRVSYKLHLKGPSININTACSTSLTAVHLACQGLLNGECDIALAGGASIKVPQETGYFYQEGGILSPDGHCRTFDVKAHGTVPGSGVGIIVLKRLSEALSNGDFIHAVIKGSAINNDGAEKIGFTAPSIDGQARVIAEALAIAQVQPEDISYIEAHGTATPLGDAIEIEALHQIFRPDLMQRGTCAIGSIKTNIGHLDAAAGIAGLIKTTLALQHRSLPPSLHFEHPNSKIDLANSPFFVNALPIEWKTEHPILRAGVSSFGIGGTNVHVVLEEAPLSQPSSVAKPMHLLTLSAKTSTALEMMTRQLSEYLKHNPHCNFADIAYTLHIGRSAFQHRRIIVAQNSAQALESMLANNNKNVISSVQNTEPLVAFLFPGQGSQYVTMAAEIYQTEKEFRTWVDLCSELLQPLLGLDLRHVLYPQDMSVEDATAILQQTDIAQVALFVIEYSLAKLWQFWGILPCAMVGHSIGEYVAACLANVFSLEDALQVVAARGQLMQKMPHGSMLAVSLPCKEIEPLLSRTLTLAAINGPSDCVVAGPLDAIDVLQEQLIKRDVKFHLLHTSHAFHSQMLEPMLEEFAERVRQVRLKAPQLPYLSNVSGTWITEEEATNPQYWVRHMRQCVHFADNLHTLLQQPDMVLLEVGPGQTLRNLALRHPSRTIGHQLLATLHQSHDQHSDSILQLHTLGRLWLVGAKVDWVNFHTEEKRHRLPLPTYPFERLRYWVEPQDLQREVNRPEVQEYSQQEKKVLNRLLEPSLDTVAPRNQVEETLIAIWQELFGIKQIGIYDNYYDLGGSSLLAIQLMTRVRDSFQVDITINNFFEKTTIAEQAELIANSLSSQEELRAIEQILAEVEMLSPDNIAKTVSDVDHYDEE